MRLWPRSIAAHLLGALVLVSRTTLGADVPYCCRFLSQLVFSFPHAPLFLLGGYQNRWQNPQHVPGSSVQRLLARIGTPTAPSRRDRFSLTSDSFTVPASPALRPSTQSSSPQQPASLSWWGTLVALAEFFAQTEEVPGWRACYVRFTGRSPAAVPCEPSVTVQHSCGWQAVVDVASSSVASSDVVGGAGGTRPHVVSLRITSEVGEGAKTDAEP